MAHALRAILGTALPTCTTAGRMLSVFAILASAASHADAHPFTITDTIVLLKSDGTFQVDMQLDADALALGVSSTAPSSELAAALKAMPLHEFAAAVERARSTLDRRVRVRFDGEPVGLRIDFPQMANAEPVPNSEPTVLGTIARLTGRIPPNAKAFSFFASRALSAVHLTIFDQSAVAATKFILSPGEESPSYRIGSGQGPSKAWGVAAQYLMLGFEHILPKGLDHIFFVLGLFLLSTHLKPLLWQITAFTLAHSVTLALSTYGLVALPSRLVESLIALSIAYVAVENLLTTELKPWRPAVVFLFGLLHGLGFAGVLRELGLPRSDFLAALLAFNVGVECGQIAVVLLALLLVGWLRSSKRYRPVIVIPASLLIAAVGMYWFVTRALGTG